MELFLILIWIVGSILVGKWYGDKGGNGFSGFLFSLMLSPLLGVLFVLASDPGEKCPFCKERIKKGASVCPHCQRTLVKAEPRQALTKVCPDCGKEVGIAASVCLYCQHQF